jgi:3-deoxy-D-manno-octulosonic acid (KDO) 8-phosphate synthase
MDFKQYVNNRFFVIAGPCVVESEEICMRVAEKVGAYQSSFRYSNHF